MYILDTKSVAATICYKLLRGILKLILFICLFKIIQDGYLCELYALSFHIKLTN